MVYGGHIYPAGPTHCDVDLHPYPATTNLSILTQVLLEQSLMMMKMHLMATERWSGVGVEGKENHCGSVRTHWIGSLKGGGAKWVIG